MTSAIYTSTPPTEPARRPALRLARVCWRELDRRAPHPAHDRSYAEELLRCHGIAAGERRFSGGRTTFRDLVSGIVPDLVPHHENFGVALLAHATPDAEPGWPMSRLATLVPGSGPGFAVSDHGTTSAFTALRLAEVTVPDVTRALVLVADQASPVFDGDPVPEPWHARRNAVAALVLDVGGELGRPEVCQRAGVPAESVPRLMRSWLAEVGRPAPLIIGAGLAGVWDGAGADLRQAPPGMPCAGIWSVLADALNDPNRGDHTVLLADYDALHGYLGTCVLIPGSRHHG
jgi:hypothetical protein